MHTIQVSSCVSVQGDLVEHLPNGEVLVRDGGTIYRGRPIAPVPMPLAHVAAQARPRSVSLHDEA